MSSQFGNRDGRFPRRRLLQAGTLGFCGLSLPQLLAARSRAASGNRRAESCIFIVLSGGLSHIDTFDPKPHAPKEIRGIYHPIATALPGVHFTEKLPELARLADRFTLIRSMSHADTVHVTAAHTMLTGQPDGSRSNDSPFLGSLIARYRPGKSALPAYVWLHNMKTGTNKVPRYNSGLHKIGMDCAPLRIGHELDNPAAPDFRVTQFDPPGDVAPQQIAKRFRLLDELQRHAATPDSRPLHQYGAFAERARELINGPAARKAFKLGLEPEPLRDRYGRHPLGQYLLMARRLIEAGVPLVTVTGWPGLAPGETTPTVTQVWDMHDSYYSAGDNQYGNGPYGMKWSLPRLDQALSALLIDLDDRGLLDETLVVVIGEFGRSPKFEGRGLGRGHWPHCYSGILAGGGARRGAVYGASDNQGGYVAGGRPISHVDFGATLVDALGIPPETRYGPDNFSFRVSQGEPVRELFG